MIVHCAAERRPDVVDSQPDAASQLNVAASGNIAKEAGKKKCTWMQLLPGCIIILYSITSMDKYT